jgi:hypothetical protein
MFRNQFHFFASRAFSQTLITAAFMLASTSISAQCPPLVSGLQGPLGITASDKDNLFVSESGSGNGDGRISIVDRHGNLKTLLGGLPSAINDVNEPSGPAGLFLRGRTLFVAIGVGDTVRNGPAPGTTIANPSGASSPIFSSVLAIRFGENFVEKKTSGFTLTADAVQALANGELVRLSNGGGDRITVRLVANFPDFVSEPLPNLPVNGRGSNPFDLVLVSDRNRHDGDDDRDHHDEHDRNRCDREFLYVTDGGRNLVWKVDLDAGAFSILAVFPLVSNPVVGIGGPFVEAVPTGITFFNSRLLVTLFRGFPFPSGVSVVEQVDPLSGNHSPFITGLKTAIDILTIRKHEDIDYLLLQHDTFGPPPFPPFSSPGLLLHFETPAGPPSVVANCLIRPTSMAFVDKRDTLYVTELGGRIVAIPFAP